MLFIFHDDPLSFLITYISNASKNHDVLSGHLDKPRLEPINQLIRVVNIIFGTDLQGEHSEHGFTEVGEDVCLVQLNLLRFLLAAEQGVDPALHLVH